MNHFRTDLAIELRENLSPQGDDIPGVEMTIEEDIDMGVRVTWVEITTEEGEAAMGKPKGNYITLESGAMKENDTELHEDIAKILARKIGRLHSLGKEATILVVGLGNRYVTPDALGPQVCEKMLVTRHLGDAVPEELTGRLRGVAALAPGVMGITGIETAEIVKGVVERTKPDLVIAIDALAARRTSRVNATIQISDTGISPGAGLGNRRMAINEESMGVPVIAVGVPTVVDAATLVNDTMDQILSAMAEATIDSQPFYNMLETMETSERYGIITEIMEPYASNMFVTPKEVDAVITRLARIIANALNIALHSGITLADVGRFLE